MRPLRLRFQPLIWRSLWPLRAVALRWPDSVLAPVVIRGGIQPLMPPAPAFFVAELGPKRRVPLLYSELIGTYVHLYGPGYEEAEAAALRASVRPETVAIDAGAHAGLITTVLADAVGPDGRVWSIEPGAETAKRLRHAVELSGHANVEVIEAAASDEEGELRLSVGRDPALTQVVGEAAGRTVPAVTLDAVWSARGEPEVSVVKIDVEGAELSVLRGAAQLLERWHPTLLLEANGERERDALLAILEPLGYEGTQPAGFAAFNYLFVAR
jgi:FkbM family methyltransferase